MSMRSCRMRTISTPPSGGRGRRRCGGRRGPCGRRGGRPRHRCRCARRSPARRRRRGLPDVALGLRGAPAVRGVGPDLLDVADRARAKDRAVQAGSARFAAMKASKSKGSAGPLASPSARASRRASSALVLLEEAEAGADDLAGGGEAAGGDLGLDEAEEVGAEGDGGVLGHGRRIPVCGTSQRGRPRAWRQLFRLRRCGSRRPDVGGPVGRVEAGDPGAAGEFPRQARPIRRRGRDTRSARSESTAGGSTRMSRSRGCLPGPGIAGGSGVRRHSSGGKWPTPQLVENTTQDISGGAP